MFEWSWVKTENCIGEEGSLLFGEELKRNTSLVTLELAGNKLVEIKANRRHKETIKCDNWNKHEKEFWGRKKKEWNE